MGNISFWNRTENGHRQAMMSWQMETHKSVKTLYKSNLIRKASANLDISRQ